MTILSIRPTVQQFLRKRCSHWDSLALQYQLHKKGCLKWDISSSIDILWMIKISRWNCGSPWQKVRTKMSANILEDCSWTLVRWHFSTAHLLKYNLVRKYYLSVKRNSRSKCIFASSRKKSTRPRLVVDEIDMRSPGDQYANYGD